MIGGNHVDGSVQDSLHQSLPVGFIPQRRVHLEAAILLKEAVIHCEVVGACFTGHVQTFRLGLPDQGNALLGGDVADVVGAAGFLHQLQIPGDLAPLALGADAPVTVGGGVDAAVNIASPKEGIVLAVGGDNSAQGLGTEHGLAHHLVALNTPSVVGEGDCLRGHSL